MNAAAIAIVILYFMVTALAVVLHGKSRENYNAFAALLNLAMMGFLFYQAGLFK